MGILSSYGFFIEEKGRETRLESLRSEREASKHLEKNRKDLRGFVLVSHPEDEPTSPKNKWVTELWIIAPPGTSLPPTWENWSATKTFTWYWVPNETLGPSSIDEALEWLRSHQFQPKQVQSAEAQS